MKRRAVLTGFGGAAAALATFAGGRPAGAQDPGRTYRLAHLANSKASESLTQQITLPELARLGFVAGRNLEFESRVGEPDMMRGLMDELLAGKPDAIVAVGEAAVVAAGTATRTVPVVAFGSDLLALGLAVSIAQPGGNVTGVSILTGDLEAKRLSILREAVPDRRRVAALVTATGSRVSAPVLERAAPGLGLELLVFPVAVPADYRAAFAAMRKQGMEALIIGAAPELFRDARQLAALALEAGLPTVCEWAEMTRDGCMIGYGPSRTELRKRLAAQIAQIFRGVAPGRIAIEQPVTYEFALNLQVARALSITIPQSVLVRVDELIE